MSWYKVKFTLNEMVEHKATRMREAFQAVFASTSAPRDAGLFSLRSATINERYFSPGAAKIAMPIIQAYGGIKCPAPKRSQVSVVVAGSGAEHIPFAPEDWTAKQTAKETRSRE